MDKPAPLFMGLDTVIVRVRDLALARAWYEEKLALKSVYASEDERLVVFDPGGTTSLTIWETKPGEKPARKGAAGGFPIFRAEDARATRELLRGRGVRVEPLKEGAGVRYFTFFDLDGNRLEVCQIL